MIPTVTRFANRFKPTEYINIESESTMSGPIESGWLSAQWVIEPVSGTPFVRFKNVWKPERYLNIESGVPAAGPVQPGWLSAQWQFDEIPDSPFARIRSRWPLVRYAHIESGGIAVGHAEPGWLSAQWMLERVPRTAFVRLKSHWKPDQGLHIESGVLASGLVEPGMLSGQWSVESVPGTAYVRFRNRWKPDQYFHIENGAAEAGPIQPGWLSAEWLLEPVPLTNFVRLRNRWEIERYLHIEGGVLAAGAIEPGWLSAQWTTAVRNKVVPLDLLQEKFDEFVNKRDRPLFKFQLDGKKFGSSALSVFFDDPIVGYRLHGTPTDLGHLEIDLPGFLDPDYFFQDLNTDGITLDVIPGEPAGVEVKIHFETAGEELKINNCPNVNFDGLHVTLKFRFGLDWANNLVELATNEKLIVADASVNVGKLIPDGAVAREIESKLNTKIFEAIREGMRDQPDAPGINRRMTRFLLGGDFDVTLVSSNAQALTIHYLVPHGGKVEPFPERPQAPLAPGLLDKIDHIVVLMMENRSFDHMLGYLSKHGGRADVDGLRGGEKNRYLDTDFPSFPLSETLFPVSPCHRAECVAAQVNGGKLDGFVTNFSKHNQRANFPDLDPGAVMGYYDAAKVPVYDALAREFLICQRWFAAHPGPTFPNRFYTMTGRLNRDSHGEWEPDNSNMSAFVPVATKTIFDHLTAQGVSWHYYEHGYCFLRMFERYTFDHHNVLSARDATNGFFAHARAGTLPSVSFIDPDFIDVPPGNDDGAPADVAAGQNLIGEVVRAVMRGPKWNKTLLLITYDEHGGFFDHVPPPAAVPVSAIDRYGVRVPAFVISPWVERGKVSNIVFDHTSILKTIIRRFLGRNPPDMGERVAQANDLSQVLSEKARLDKLDIPQPAKQVPQAAFTREAARDLERDPDFKGLLHAMRSRYPTRAPSPIANTAGVATVKR